MSKKKINYTIIRSEDQYMAYCRNVEEMTNDYKVRPTEDLLDLIETITLLIDKYGEDQLLQSKTDPIQLLDFLMRENNLKQKELAKILGLSKGHLSDILNYKKGLSKNVIQILSEYFKVRQDAFNRPYKLMNQTIKKKNIPV